MSSATQSRELASFIVLLLITSYTAGAQTVARAYVSEDKKVHVIDSSGVEREFAPGPQQVGYDNVAIAPDHRAVGWTVLVENCCTSYPVPTSLVLYRGNKRTVISPGQMIWEWYFAGGSDRVAVLSGPVHGRAARAQLFSTQNGKLLGSWNGKGDAPQWAIGWDRQFEP